MNKIEFIDVNKKYGEKQVLQQINFTITPHDFIAIIGESGCGKTTLLKLINKMVNLTSGKILIDNQNYQKIDNIKLRRSIDYVIQNIGLLPHLSVADNMTYVLKLNNKPKNIRYQRAKELIDLMNLPQDCLDKKPKNLSGGQQQRVGVARALAANPSLILMDEPFSALDAITRAKMQDDLLKIYHDLCLTVVFVTHDIEEALKLANKIMVMKDGEIVQFSSPEDLILHPINDYVRKLVGLKGLQTLIKTDKILDLCYQELEICKNKQ